MIKLLIFDIGGVLIKFKEIDYVRYIAKKYHIRVYEFARALFPYIDSMELGTMKLKDVEKSMSEVFDIRNSGLEWDAAYKKLAKVDKRPVALVNRLSRRYKVALLSNVSATRFDIMRTVLIKGLKARGFASCYLHMRKPDPKIYLHVIAKMRVKPQEAIFIDDFAENVVGARRAGLAAIQYKNYPQLIKDLKKKGVMV